MLIDCVDHWHVCIDMYSQYSSPLFVVNCFLCAVVLAQLLNNVPEEIHDCAPRKLHHTFSLHVKVFMSLTDTLLICLIFMDTVASIMIASALLTLPFCAFKEPSLLSAEFHSFTLAFLSSEASFLLFDSLMCSFILCARHWRVNQLLPIYFLWSEFHRLLQTWCKTSACYLVKR